MLRPRSIPLSLRSTVDWESLISLIVASRQFAGPTVAVATGICVLLNITFNDSNLSEVFEYQSESSLLDEYLREERGINGNPRVGNLPRQEAKVEEDDDVDLGDLSVPGAKNDNVLAHEGIVQV